MKTLFFVIGTAALCAQSNPRNSVTFSGGWANNAGNTCCGDSAASLGLTYAYRVIPHFALEAGVDSAIGLGTEVRGANVDVKLDDRMLWVPFGVRGILPLRNGRVELFIGAGGLYENYHVTNAFTAFGLESRNGWGGYVSGGGAVALDRGRRFWLGGSSHFYFANTNNGYSHDRWVTATLDLGFHF